MPFVSVVIPACDRRDLLADALASVLGSSDGTAEMVTALQDPRVRLLRLDSPVGVSAARNRGIAEASGRWAALLDDDDL